MGMKYTICWSSTVGFVSNLCRNSDSIHDSDTLLEPNLTPKFRRRFDSIDDQSILKNYFYVSE